MVATGNVIVAYFASWSIYGPKYNVWDIDASRLSHINYAFANIDPSSGLVILGDPYADAEQVNTGNGDSWTDPADVLHGNLHQLFRLKQKNRHLKVGVSIGGWTWSGEFSKVAASERGRKKFVASAVQMLLDYGFDYIDLDWEYPGGEGLEGNASSPNDPANFVLLLQEFQTQFAQHFPDPADRPYVTIASACSEIVYKKYHLKEMAKLLKYINIMCYDFAGPWSPVSEHQANLYPRNAKSKETHSADVAIKYYISQGVAPGQLVLGVPFYGREFAACPGLLQPFHGTGKGSWEAGIYDYKALPLNAGYKTLWEKATNSSFQHNPKSLSLITYDDQRALAFKMDYVQKMKLGGAMFWEISGDKATSNDGSLLRTIADWLGGSKLDRSPNRVCYPASKFRNIRMNTICPSPSTKDEVQPSADEEHYRRWESIVGYCLGLFEAAANDYLAAMLSHTSKAHAIPSMIERLHECYKLIAERPDLDNLPTTL